MFFLLGNTCSNLQKRFQFTNGVNLFLDEGWTHTEVKNKSVFYKGYCLDYNIDSDIKSIIEDDNPVEGLFCVIMFNHDTDMVTFKYSAMRGFPVNHTDDCITNLPLENSHRLPTPIRIVMDKGVVRRLDEHTPFVPYVSDKIVDGFITPAVAASIIGDILYDNVCRFVDNNPVKLNFSFSGGIDTLTIWSVLSRVTTNYTVDLDKIVRMGDGRETHPFKQEYVTDLHKEIKKHHWGYRQIECSEDAKYFITGFWGDEIMFRNPAHINYLANVTGTTAEQLAKDNPHSYMSNYLLKEKNHKIVSKREVYNAEMAKNKVMDEVTNDPQMWHINNNIYFSPFFDFRILEVMWNLSLEDILDQSLNATIQKHIVKSFRTEMLPFLDSFKNDSASSYVNFRKNYLQ